MRFFHLRDNPVWRRFRPWYYGAKRIFTNPPKPQPDNEAAAFFTQNAARVAAVANLFADARDRKIFEQIIRFRQTRALRDFPPYERKTSYFHVFPLGRGEVYADCGAFKGETLDEFIKCCPGYQHIVAFEPDAKNFATLREKHGNTRDTTLLEKGAYDHDGEVFFFGGGEAGTVVADNRANATGIRVTTLDSLNLEKVTFIKMDIEGAELNALKGAEKILLRDKPKLAVCIYHSNGDMLRIAEYLHALVPGYRFQIRHHDCYPAIAETVLYAKTPPV